MKRFHSKFNQNWKINQDFRILGVGNFKVQTFFSSTSRWNFNIIFRKMCFEYSEMFIGNDLFFHLKLKKYILRKIRFDI